MTYQSPFTITTQIIDLISAVSEKVGFVQRYFLDASVNALKNAPVNIEEMKTPDAILALVQADNSITRQQMAERMGKDIRTIGRAIKKLQDEGKLQRVGSDKAGHWEVL